MFKISLNVDFSSVATIKNLKNEKVKKSQKPRIQMCLKYPQKMYKERLFYNGFEKSRKLKTEMNKSKIPNFLKISVIWAFYFRDIPGIYYPRNLDLKF